MSEKDLQIENEIQSDKYADFDMKSGTDGAAAIEYYIEKLPREFRRGLLTRFDKLFILILIFSSIFNISGILLLEKYYSHEVPEKKISKIQQRFASLLLNKDFAYSGKSNNIVGTTYEKNVKVLTGLQNYVENFTFDLNNYFNRLTTADIPLTASQSQGALEGLSREEMANMRQSFAQQRIVSRSELSRKVESVGLLNLLSSKNGSADKEYVQDLLKYATSNNQQLQKVLSKLDRLKVPHAGNELYKQRLALRQSGDYTNAIKGERKSADQAVESIIRNMKPLQQAKSEVVTRNTRYETLPSSSMASVGERKIVRRRTAKMVMATIRSHLRSLQDCYKRELKQDPSLRGKVSVRFTVTPKGRVIAAQLVSSTFNNPRLEACILGKIRRWRDFPPCDSSLGNQTFRQTFKFGM